MRVFGLLSCLGLVGLTSWALPVAAATPPASTEFAQGLDPSRSRPSSIVAGPDGNIWFTDYGQCGTCGAIGWSTQAGVITELPLTINATSLPVGMARGPSGDPNLWFADIGATPAIGHIALDNSNAIEEISTGFAAFPYPLALVAGSDGNLWFADGNSRIGKITSAFAITEYGAASGMPTDGSPYGIAAGSDGNLWFTDTRFNGAIGKASIVGHVLAKNFITEYSQANGLNAASFPVAIVAGPDGNLWFADRGTTPAIGRITTAGVITEFSAGLRADAIITGIVAGPDGNIWFTDSGIGPGRSAEIGRITPAGIITEFTAGLTPGNYPDAITTGPDGNLWFTDWGCSNCSTVIPPAIGRMTLPTDVLNVSLAGTGSGEVTSPLSGVPTGSGIACGNGNAACSVAFLDATSVTLTATAAAGSTFLGWEGLAAEAGGCTGTAPCVVPLSGNVDSLITATFAHNTGSVGLSVTTFGSGTVTSSPSGISCGTTCTANFTSGTVIALSATPAPGYTFTGWGGGGCSGVEACTVTLNATTTVAANFAANSTSDIILVSAALPSSRSVQVGAAATIFGTMINASSDTAGATCDVQPATGVPVIFQFQTTDSTTNALTGTPNTPVTIPPNGVQSFELSLTPTALIAPTQVTFTFTCRNASAAPSYVGLNTLLLSAATTPTPDIIALSATATKDGIVDLPGASGTGAFVVATINLGSASPITVSANIGTANLPVALSLCETVPATGQCMAPPAATVTTSVAAEATPTFAVFVQGSGMVPFQPAANRVFVQFQDAGSAIRGLTSVAVRTQ